MNLGKLVQSKTFWTGVTTIALSAVGLYTKTINLETAVAGIIGGLALIFMRQAVEKSGLNGGVK